MSENNIQICCSVTNCENSTMQDIDQAFNLLGCVKLISNMIKFHELV